MIRMAHVRSMIVFFFVVLFFFVCLSSFQSTAAESARNTKQNVLLITIDTLRSDRLSCYGSEHLQTPTIDKWANNGVLFTKAFAHTSTTLPSHTNILCGTTPLYHGVHDNFNFILSPEQLTLAEHLKASGYSTGAFIGGFPLDSRFGLDQGFDTYDDNFKTRTDIEIEAEFVVNKALSWLEHQKNPWFCWIHCYDPHDPYTPPEPFKKQHENDLYNGEVAYVDSVLERLADYLDKSDLYKNTLIVFTADHGEALDQHGERTHGFFAYNEVIWIPLIIHMPGITEGRIDEYVSHIDIFPTICDVLEIKKPPFLQGISLVPALKEKKISQRILYFESLYPYYSRGWAPLRGFIENDEKYLDSPIPELYDIKRDFNELNNLAKGKKLEAHKKKLEKFVKDQSYSGSDKPGRKIDPEALRKLESLGYISNPNISLKESYGPEDDIKILLPHYNKADLTNKLYENDEISLNDAIESLKEVITATHQIDIAYKGLASLYREMGKPQDAVDVLKIGIENHPSSYEILRDLVFYLSELGQDQEVISFCKSNYVVQMDFETDIWNVLGYAYWRTGDLENAQETFERALSIDDEDPTLLANFGNVNFSFFQKTKESNYQKKAIELFEKAIELDPNLAQAYDGLGIAFLVSGDLDKAISYWEMVMKIAPSHTNTVYNLSRAYLTKGEKQKALALLERFLKTNSHRLSPENKRIFDELKKSVKKFPD